MKNHTNSLILFSLLLISFSISINLKEKTNLPFYNSNPQFNSEYILDYWVGTGYKCDGISNDEDIHVSNDNGKFNAVKVKGNPCVPKDNITFSGNVLETVAVGKKIPITLIVGNPQNPSSQFLQDQIEIVDINNFRLVSHPIKFRRGRIGHLAPEISKPSSSQTNLSNLKNINQMNYFSGYWIGNGYKCGNQLNLSEDVIISNNTGYFSAFKLLGDDCVPAGKITFTGKFAEDINLNIQNIPIDLILGSPSNQSSNHTNSNIKIIDINHFEIPQYELKFERHIQNYNRDYFTGKWILNGLGCEENSNEYITVAFNNLNKNSFECIKLKGSGCLITGQVILNGDLPDTFTDTTNFIVTFHHGSVIKNTILRIRNYHFLEIPEFDLFLVRLIEQERVITSVIEKVVEYKKEVIRTINKVVDKIIHCTDYNITNNIMKYSNTEQDQDFMKSAAPSRISLKPTTPLQAPLVISHPKVEAQITAKSEVVLPRSNKLTLASRKDTEPENPIKISSKPTAPLKVPLVISHPKVEAQITVKSEVVLPHSTELILDSRKEIRHETPIKISIKPTTSLQPLVISHPKLEAPITIKYEAVLPHSNELTLDSGKETSQENPIKISIKPTASLVMSRPKVEAQIIVKSEVVVPHSGKLTLESSKNVLPLPNILSVSMPPNQKNKTKSQSPKVKQSVENPLSAPQTNFAVPKQKTQNLLAKPLLKVESSVVDSIQKESHDAVDVSNIIPSSEIQPSKKESVSELTKINVDDEEDDDEDFTDYDDFH